MGSNIRSDIQKITRRLDRKDEINRRDGFLWPADVDTIYIRTNTDEARRGIEDIPLEELAKACYVILENGGIITVEDIVVEVARLYGYSRTGQKIDSRIKTAIDLLREKVGVEEVERGLQSTDCDIDAILL